MGKIEAHLEAVKRDKGKAARIGISKGGVGLTAVCLHYKTEG